MVNVVSNIKGRLKKWEEMVSGFLPGYLRMNPPLRKIKLESTVLIWG